MTTAFAFLPSQCGAAFQEDDIIVLNGTKEDVEMLRKRMEERRLRAKLGKVSGASSGCGSARPSPMLQNRL